MAKSARNYWDKHIKPRISRFWHFIVSIWLILLVPAILVAYIALAMHLNWAWEEMLTAVFVAVFTSVITSSLFLQRFLRPKLKLEVLLPNGDIKKEKSGLIEFELLPDQSKFYVLIRNKGRTTARKVTFWGFFFPDWGFEKIEAEEWEVTLEPEEEKTWVKEVERLLDPEGHHGFYFRCHGNLSPSHLEYMIFDLKIPSDDRGSVITLYFYIFSDELREKEYTFKIHLKEGCEDNK